MAVPGFVESLLGGVEPSIKRVLVEAFRYIVPNGKFGPIEHQTKSESFQAYYSTATTAASTSEFSVVHGMGRVPYLALPFLDVTSSGSKVPVLTVTRAADANRVYLKADAGSTSAPFVLLME